MLNNHIYNHFDELLVYSSSLWFQPLDEFVEQTKEILLTAFVHKSYAADFVPTLSHNERLEFLGDSILWATVGSLLYQHYPQWSEAQMTLYKIALVREETLAKVARQIDLGSHIFLSKGEEKQGGIEKDSILSDCFEALLGACYLIYGYEQVHKFIERSVWKELDELIQTNCKSYKSLIQERAQGQGLPLPAYHTTEQQQDGEVVFYSEITIQDQSYGSGYGRNKKKSQEAAAKDAYSKRSSLHQ